VAVVGDAYIVVKAITTGFERDVRRSLNGIDIGSDGSSIGESFTKGFNNSISKGLGKKFDFSAGEADAARLAFQTLVRTSFTLTAAIGPLIAGIGSLGGGFVSLVSIVGAATPALVVLPGIFTAIGLAAITTVAALGGVGKAVSAGLNQQKKATQENTAAKIAAARRVEDIEKRIEELNKDSFRLERDRLKDLAEAEQDKAKAAEDAAAKEQEAVEKKTLVVQEAAKKEKEAIEEKASAVQEAALREEEADKRLSLVKEQNTEAMIEANNRLKEAQIDLTKALEDGREEIQQLGFDAEDAALSEKRASITLEKARETLQRTQDLPPNTRARREAQLAFAEAELGLRRAKDKNKDLQKEQDKLAGDPKNTEGYIGALKRQEDAQVTVAQTARDALRAQQEAEANLSSVRASNAKKILDAEKNIADVKIDNARKIADVEKNIADVKIDNARKIADAEQKYADVKQRYLDREEDLITRIQDAYDDLARALADQETANKGATGGVDAYANALKGLSPAAQAFVKYLVGTFVPALKKLRDAAAEALLPLLKEGLEKLRTELFDPLEPMLAKLATSIGKGFNSIIDSIVKPENIKDLEKVFEQSGYIVEGLGKTIGSVYDSILSILVAADPLIRKFTDFITKKTGDFAKFLNTAQASGELEAFFTKAGNIAAQLSGVFGNLFSGISNVISANFEPGGGGYIVLDWLEKITGKFETFSGSVAGKASLAEYFKGAATNSIAILESVGAFVKEILKVGADPNVKVFFDTLKGGAPIFGDILKSSVEAGPSLARLVVSILRFTKATTDAGAIKIFFDTLNTVLTAINTLLENKFIKAVFDATGKILAFGLALGTIGKVGKFGTKVVESSLRNIGTLVKAIVPAPVVASVTSGLETIALKGMYAFDAVKKGAKDTAKAIASELGNAIKDGSKKFVQLGKDAASATKTIATDLGKAIKGAGTDLAAFAKEGGARMAEFGKAAGTAAMGGLTTLLGKLKLLGLFFVTNPIGIAITAITILAGLFVLLYKNSETFRTAVQNAFEKIKEGATMALDWLKQNWPLILAVLTGPFGLMVLAIAKNWDSIVANVKAIPAKLKEAGSAMWTWLTTNLSDAWKAAQIKFTEIVTGIKAIPGRIGNGLSNIWSGLTNGLETAWKNAKAWWNANVATKKLKIGGATVFGQTLPSFTLGFPQLAQGGIVPATPGGTIARIGEAGRPERVEPLDPQGLSKRDRAMIQMLAGGSGAGATINVYPSQGMNESELASIISRQIAFQLRRGGA